MFKRILSPAELGAAMSKTSLDKSKIKILLLEGVHASAVEAFRADGYTNIEVPFESAA
jgi:hypothetical protein